MKETFEQVIQGILEQGFAVVDDFLDEELLCGLRRNLCIHIANEDLQLAGIGKDIDFQKDREVRRDQVFWLSEKPENDFEDAFLRRIRNFIDYLNRTCFTALNSFEFHYALYPPGAFYKRHLDQFRHDDSRRFSLICYLNDRWSSTDGGELLLYLPDKELKIQPLGGRLVCFESDKIEHEVLVTQRERMSITGWLKSEIYF